MRRITKIALMSAITAGAVLLVAPRASAFPPAAVEQQTRSLNGTVRDKNDAPLPNAIVYLKNMRTLAVKTYIAGDGGVYRFNGLSPNADYEVYAEFNGARSDTKTISSFDGRKAITYNLKVDTAK